MLCEFIILWRLEYIQYIGDVERCLLVSQKATERRASRIGNFKGLVFGGRSDDGANKCP